ncbi:MAG TPA: HAMP domain-containing sensor histidine kinase [Chryseolinea sp.]|nr:HAMP domain-containing sensor histidine kinase [Chryseolinea sp.]
MRNNRVFRVLVVLGISSLVGLLVIQVYWFASAYSLEEKRLNERITLALRDVANQVGDIRGDRPAVLQKLSTNRFQLTYSRGVTYEMLDSLVRITFLAHDLSLPFQVIAYNGGRDITFGNFYRQGARSEGEAMCLKHGMATATAGLITITFPEQTANIVGGMELWIFSASMFVFVLAVMLIMMLRLSREKRRAELRVDFISNMTHELQTPIANIALASEVLKKSGDTASRSLHYANIISSENLRLKAHIDQVLQTAMLEKGELALSKQEVDINEVVREISSVFKERIEVRGGQFSLIIEAKKPMVFADGLHLKNILYNLLDNAEKYSPESPDISVSTTDHAGGVMVSVSDKGMGIVKEYQSRIFEKFFRASKGNVHDIKGFGLGLTYVKGIVEAHNGTVTVRSTPGEGSRFEVLLQNCL